MLKLLFAVDGVDPRTAVDDDRKQTARVSRQSTENHTANTPVRLVPSAIEK